MFEGEEEEEEGVDVPETNPAVEQAVEPAVEQARVESTRRR